MCLGRKPEERLFDGKNVGKAGYFEDFTYGFVYVLNEDGTVTYQEVVLGRRMGTEYEVLEGLKDGDTVVTGGQIRLKNGVKVEVK